MSVTALASRQQHPTAAAIEAVLVKGDLSQLSEDQRLSHYKNVCESLGLNPLTQPFDYIKLNGKLILYAKRDAAEQLRKIHGVSITSMKADRFDDVYVVTVQAQDKSGRTDMSTGAVSLGTLKGEPLANALLKAETKAKRRVTLSICGLGMLDETEVETIRQDAPPLVIEAKPERAPAPEGYCYIDRITPKRKGNYEWAEVLTSVGEVVIAKGQMIALLEQIAQDGQPVDLVTAEKAKRNGDTVIEVMEAHRAYERPVPEPEVVSTEPTLEDSPF